MSFLAPVLPFLKPLAKPLITLGGGLLGKMFGGGDRGGQSDQEKTQYNQINDLTNQLSSTAKQFQPYSTNFLDTAKSSYGKALSFWAPLLSGNRSLSTSVLSPDINRINDQFDSILQSTGGQRTGAGASIYASAPYEKQSQIQGLFSSLRPQAAQAMGTLGSQTGQLGTQSLYAITNALGQALGGQQNLLDNAYKQKLYQQQTGEGLGGLFSDLIRGGVDIFKGLGKSKNMGDIGSTAIGSFGG